MQSIGHMILGHGFLSLHSHVGHPDESFLTPWVQSSGQAIRGHCLILDLHVQVGQLFSSSSWPLSQLQSIFGHLDLNAKSLSMDLHSQVSQLFSSTLNPPSQWSIRQLRLGHLDK